MLFLSYSYLHSFQEDSFRCKTLSTTGSGTEILKLLYEFFTDNSVLWDNCVDACANGVKVMTSKMSCAIAKIKVQH